MNVEISIVYEYVIWFFIMKVVFGLLYQKSEPILMSKTKTIPKKSAII